MNNKHNYIELIDELMIDSQILDEKKQQTDCKIEYITKYVNEWLYVNTARDIKNIIFIDCMCNAGIYRDGDLGTGLRVLQLFSEFAKDNPNKRFMLIANDVKKERRDCFEMLAKSIMPGVNNGTNLFLHMHNDDVNDFLMKQQYFDLVLKDNSMVIMFVDPYDLGTVRIPLLRKFINRYYCEVFFNLFISDYVRNHLDDRIKACIDSNNIENKDDMIEYVHRQLRAGKMRYIFSYRFKIQTNTELYHILYATPSERGLEKLKDVLWDVFEGKYEHKNVIERKEQLSLFETFDRRELLLSQYAEEAQALITSAFKDATVSYNDILVFILENTMMKKGQVINYVIKPLIADNRIKKKGLVRSNNYTGDNYIIC